MRFEPSAPSDQLAYRTALQRPGRLAVRSPQRQSIPLRISLDGILLPLVLLIIITISRVHQYFGFLAQVRPALLLFLWAIAMFAFGGQRKLALENWKEWPVRLVIGLGAAAVLSMPFGISFGGSASFIVNSYWKVIVLCLMVGAAVRSRDDLWTLVWAYVIAIGILSWMALTVFQMETTNGFSRLGEGFTYDANDIGLVCVTGIPLCLLTLRTSRTTGKVASLIILALACMAIARTGSRGAFMGIVTVALSLLLMARGIGFTKRVVIAVVGAGVLAVAAPPGYLKQIGTITDPTADYNWTSRTGRKAVAMRGLGYLARNPVTGIGIANFNRAEGMLSDAAADFENGGAGVKWSGTHNSFLQATVEMGVLGGLLFVGVVGAGMASGRRVRARIGRGAAESDEHAFLQHVADFLPIAFVGFAVCAFFLGFAYMDLIYLLAAFAAAALGLARRATQPAHAAPPPYRHPRARPLHA